MVSGSGRYTLDGMEYRNGALELVIRGPGVATLDNLREGGRTVGLISHVASMKESIPAQLSVEKVPGGWSVIRQESSS